MMMMMMEGRRRRKERSVDYVPRNKRQTNNQTSNEIPASNLLLLVTKLSINERIAVCVSFHSSIRCERAKQRTSKVDSLGLLFNLYEKQQQQQQPQTYFIQIFNFGDSKKLRRLFYFFL